MIREERTNTVAVKTKESVLTLIPIEKVHYPINVQGKESTTSRNSPHLISNRRKTIKENTKVKQQVRKKKVIN